MRLRLAVFSGGLVLALVWLLSVTRAPSAGAVTKPAREASRLAHATFAAGCFWCIQPPFEGVPGVSSTIVGYAGGHVKNPTYEQVSSGTTGHAEAMRIAYDPALVSYEQLLEVFWHNVDPTDAGGQFCDRGSQYRSAVFYESEEQKQAALASKRQLDASKRFSRPVATEVTPLEAFYPAEDYHQDYWEGEGRSNPYCLAVIPPKLQKLRKSFAARLKSEAAEG